MNGKKARALRDYAGFNPSDPRQYEKTVMPDTIIPIPKDGIYGAQFMGFDIIGPKQAQALGYSGKESSFYAVRSGPIRSTGNRHEYQALKREYSK